ncbi:acyltransferase family protein [Paenibacillus pasadenensis]|uniref:acyltransferase family protein n=1 Tax=Paenibacillus pasadenensis TaxID=217090 RepID=UPI0004280826|nr:acyltransferase [Paenibacillus pasadenensis]
MNDVSLDNKLVYLDGLRGLAAFAVVISHYMQVFYPAALSGNPQQAHSQWDVGYGQTPLNLFYNGQFAVCLFFVLSGYVLSVRFFKRQLDPEAFLQSLQSSAVRRYLRLAVPAAASVGLVYLGLMTHAFHLKDIWEATGTDMKKDYYALDQHLYTVIKAAVFDPFFRFESHPYNPVLWTMSYELLGSFLIFGFIALFGRAKRRWIVYVVLSLAFIQTYFVAFLWGMLLADLLRGRWIRRTRSTLLVLAAGIYLGSAPYIPLKGTMYEPIAATTALFNGWIQLDLDSRLLARTAGAAMILFALQRLKLLQLLLAWRPFAYLGKVSFSLYLVHFTVLTTFSAYMFSKAMAHFGYNIAYAITFAASMPPLFILSHFYMKHIDQGAIKLARSVERKMTAPSAMRRRAETDDSTLSG